MHVLNEEETIHLFVVPEDQLPRKPDYLSIGMVTLACLCIFAVLGISVFSAAPSQEVSFTVSVPTMHLVPVSKTLRTTVIATGKGHVAATDARGMITFYNGQTYTQIIPMGTILKGSDGVRVITDQEAVIPPEAKTIPPTNGYTSVPAHALVPGTQGNIIAGDVNMACCVTSVIVQNPYNFTGGRNARDFTYLTAQDVKNTASSLLPALRATSLSLLPNPHLSPACSTMTTSSPSAGKEITSARLTVVETCSAFSYSVTAVAHAITAYSKRFGTGTFTHLQVFVVGVKEEVASLYVVGQWSPFAMRQFWAGK